MQHPSVCPMCGKPAVRLPRVVNVTASCGGSSGMGSDAGNTQCSRALQLIAWLQQWMASMPYLSRQWQCFGVTEDPQRLVLLWVNFGQIHSPLQGMRRRWLYLLSKFFDYLLPLGYYVYKLTRRVAPGARFTKNLKTNLG